jgi:hypothetical protein
VERLVRQMAGQAGEALPDTPEATTEPGAETAEPAAAPRPEPWAPQKQLRTCVASMADSTAFGRLVAVEAQERDFYRATRRAFVADGAAYNWAIQRAHFADFEPIVDFLHVLCYVYAAAWAVRASAAERWDQYVAWLGACWQGRVPEVLAELQAWQGRVGRPPPGEELPRTDARRAVAEALSYLTNNAPRMQYPRYRQAGLPITSSLAESQAASRLPHRDLLLVWTIGISGVELVEQSPVLVPTDEFLECERKQMTSADLHLSRQRLGLLEQFGWHRDGSLYTRQVGPPCHIPGSTAHSISHLPTRSCSVVVAHPSA